MYQDEQVFKALRDRGGIELSKVTYCLAFLEGKPNVMQEVHDRGEGKNNRAACPRISRASQVTGCLHAT